MTDVTGLRYWHTQVKLTSRERTTAVGQVRLIGATPMVLLFRGRPGEWVVGRLSQEGSVVPCETRDRASLLSCRVVGRVNLSVATKEIS